MWPQVVGCTGNETCGRRIEKQKKGHFVALHFFYFGKLFHKVVPGLFSTEVCFLPATSI